MPNLTRRGWLKIAGITPVISSMLLSKTVLAQKEVEVIHTIKSPYQTRAMTWDGGNLWIVSPPDTYDPDKIYSLNPSDGNIVNSFDPPGSTEDSLGGLYWKKDHLLLVDSGIIYNLDPTSGEVQSKLHANVNSSLTWDGSFYWAIRDTNEDIVKLDPDTGETLRSIDVTGFHHGLTWGKDFLWLVGQFEGQMLLRQIDIQTSDGVVQQEFTLPSIRSGYATTWDGTNLWVGSANETIYRVDVGEIGAPNQYPEAAFSYTPSTPSATESISFNGSDTVDPDGFIEKYEWDFNSDGIADSRGETASYTFDSGGEYDVKLTVTDDSGVTDTIVKTIDVSVNTPSPTATETESPTPTPTPTDTSTPSDPLTPTPTPTDTSTPTDTVTPISTPTNTSPPTDTLTPTLNASENEDNTNLFPIGLGLLGVGGAGAWWLTRRRYESKDSSFSSPLPTGPSSGEPSNGGLSTATTGETNRSSEPGASSLTDKAHREPRLVPEELPNAPDVSVDYDALTNKEPIGGGGNADVTKVTLSTPDGDVTLAIKEPRMSGTLHTDSVKRMLKEAETWEKLDEHDHIVGVLDYGSEPLPWIAMEYMDAGHLGERSGELDITQTLWTALAVTKGVRHAHRRGVAHLDLKPENVLFRSVEDAWDVPKVADWGLSKHLLEHSKSVEGLSPQYAAPEQFDEDFGSPDDITDIYQLGAVFYELFTGQPPFEGKPFRVIDKVKDKKPTPPSEVANVPDELDEILLTALAKEKNERYDNVAYLRDALEDLFDEY